MSTAAAPGHDGDLESVAVWRMEGYTVEEIAARLGFAPRSVKRKLQLIRGIWGKEVLAASETPLPDAEPVPLPTALRANWRADRFEAAWKTGAPPRIEVFLAGWAEPEHSVLVNRSFWTFITAAAGARRAGAEDYLAPLPAAPSGSGTLTAILAVPASAPAAAPPALEGHPRYRVLERVGAGGMGVVYRPTHRFMDRTVALKVITPAVDRPGVVRALSPRCGGRPPDAPQHRHRPRRRRGRRRFTSWSWSTSRAPTWPPGRRARPAAGGAGLRVRAAGGAGAAARPRAAAWSTATSSRTT